MNRRPLWASRPRRRILGISKTPAGPDLGSARRPNGRSEPREPGVCAVPFRLAYTGSGSLERGARWRQIDHGHSVMMQGDPSRATANRHSAARTDGRSGANVGDRRRRRAVHPRAHFLARERPAFVTAFKAAITWQGRRGDRAAAVADVGRQLPALLSGADGELAVARPAGRRPGCTQEGAVP